MRPFMHKPLMRTAALTIAVCMGLILAGCEKKPIVAVPPTKVTVAKPVMVVSGEVMPALVVAASVNVAVDWLILALAFSMI